MSITEKLNSVGSPEHKSVKPGLYGNIVHKTSLVGRVAVGRYEAFTVTHDHDGNVTITMHTANVADDNVGNVTVTSA